MTTFADIFLRMANEVEVLDTHTFCHCELGRFRWRSGQDETTQTGTLEGPPPDLWRFIYLHYHADDRAGVEALRRWPRPVISLTEREDPVFVDRLDAANQGEGFFDPGWELTAIHGADVQVRRNSLTLRVSRNEWAGPSASLGEKVSVRFPKAMRYAYPGCYLAIGNAGLCRWETDRAIRLYYAVADSDSAVSVMETLTRQLNAHRVRFQIKTMNHPSQFRRRDNFVLYLPTDAWHLLREEFVAMHRAAVAGHLRAEVPCFTLPIRHGWSFAEEPVHSSGMVSFGQHWAQLVAHGLFTAYRNGARSPEDRFASISMSIQCAGLDIEHPYRNPL